MSETKPTHCETTSRPRRPSLGRNALYKAALNLFNLFVPLLVGPYINGLLHPEALGLYNRAFSEFQIFQVLGAFGIYNYGVRELSRLRDDPFEQRRLYSALFRIGLITNVLATLVFVAFFVLRAQPSEWMVYAILLLQMLSNVFYIEFFNEAEEDYRFITRKTVAIRFLYLIGIFIFVRRAEDVVPYAVVVGMIVLLNNLASFWHIRNKQKLLWRGLDCRSHFWPLVISLILVNCDLLYAQVDRVLLGPYGSYLGHSGDVTVTLYNTAFTLVGMLASLPAAWLSVSLPRLSHQLATQGETAYQETLQVSVQNYFSLLFPLCAGLALVAPESLQIYSRGVYTYGWPILVLACMGRLLYGLQFILSNLVLYLFRAERMMTLLLFGCGVFNLLVKVVLVFGFGGLTPLTAMGTTLFSVLLFILLAYRYIRRVLGLRLRLIQGRSWIYLGASSLFLPLTALCRLLVPNFWLCLAAMILVCSLEYGLVLIVSRDPLLLSLRNKLRKAE